MVTGAPAIGAVLDLLTGVWRDAILVGHGVAFDLAVLIWIVSLMYPPPDRQMPGLVRERAVPERHHAQADRPKRTDSRDRYRRRRTIIQPPGRPGMGKPHVLIVEDEPHIVLSLEFLLQRAGYDTVAAADGEDGLALVRRLRPDVVLLDVMLPRRNGYEVCQAIKADPELRTIPVVMLSARGQEVEVLKGLELGAAAYVTKPFGNAEILEAIRAVLAARA